MKEKEGAEQGATKVRVGERRAQLQKNNNNPVSPVSCSGEGQPSASAPHRFRRRLLYIRASVSARKGPILTYSPSPLPPPLYVFQKRVSPLRPARPSQTRRDIAESNPRVGKMQLYKGVESSLLAMENISGALMGARDVASALRSEPRRSFSATKPQL